MLKRFAIMLMLAGTITQGVSAAEFSMTDIQGVSHSLAKYRGKWVLVNVWATWCAPCLSEMPELESLSRAHGDLIVLGVAADRQSPQRLKQFADRLGVTYPIIAGVGELAGQCRLRGYPTSVLFDRSGRQVLVKEGVITRQEVEKIFADAAL